MFTFPALSFLTAPVLIGDNSIDFPMIGAMVAWLLVVSLVGVLLGILRDHTSPHPERIDRKSALGETHPDIDHVHPRAA